MGLGNDLVGRSLGSVRGRFSYRSAFAAVALVCAVGATWLNPIPAFADVIGTPSPDPLSGLVSPSPSLSASEPPTPLAQQTSVASSVNSSSPCPSGQVLVWYWDQPSGSSSGSLSSLCVSVVSDPNQLSSPLDRGFLLPLFGTLAFLLAAILGRLTGPEWRP